MLHTHLLLSFILTYTYLECVRLETNLFNLVDNRYFKDIFVYFCTVNSFGTFVSLPDVHCEICLGSLTEKSLRLNLFDKKNTVKTVI